MEPEPFPDFLIYEWFAGFSKIRTSEHLIESILKPEIKTESIEIIEKQFDTALDGIKETADLIADLSKKTYEYPSPLWGRWMRSVIQNRQIYVYYISLLRFLKMNLNIRAYSVPEARRYDFFSYKEISRRLAMDDPLFTLNC